MDGGLSDDAVEEALYARAALVRLARTDFNTFAELTMRDEETGRLIRQAPIHEAWDAALEQNERCIIMAHVEAGKSNQISICRTVHMLGKDPTTRGVVVSNTQRKQADKILRGVARMITSNRVVREVFPELTSGSQWTQDMITIAGASAKDPSFQSFGVHGNIQGSRIDWLVLDDVLDLENTRSQRGRDDLYDWYMSAISGRLTARARIVVVGTAFHPDDLIHRFIRDGWPCYRFPVLDELGRPSWPERWPLARIEKRREELKGKPAEFARQMMCLPQSDDDSRFRKEWLDQCVAAGDGLVPVDSIHELDLTGLIEHIDNDPAKEADLLAPQQLSDVPRLSIYEGVRAALSEGMLGLPRAEVARILEMLGVVTFTGVDLAVTRAESGDLTSFFDLLVYPDGVKQVLNCEAGRWTGQDIVDKAIDHHQRYYSTLIVENNSSQDFLVQWIRKAGIEPNFLRAFTTGKNKAHPEFGIEGLAAEFARGEWIIPSTRQANGAYTMSPQITKWLDEVRYYDPKLHTGDRLMSSWFAREGARAWIGERQRGASGGGVRVIG